MEKIDIAVIGGGPAGLRAAEVAAGLGRRVVVFDGKPGVGRKFLVAGKGGLNLTHGEPSESFLKRYSGGNHWDGILRDFDPAALREWCHGLGFETFQASSGRVYPKALKGAPVLRAWLNRLKGLGAEIRTRHQWTELLPGRVLRFQNGCEVQANAVVFALGGASWPKTGSDGGWVGKFRKLGIECSPFKPANCGWECEWSHEIISAAEGMPMKNLRVKAGSEDVLGELLLTRYGLEGGTIYALGNSLRRMAQPALEVDFKPTFSIEQLVAKIGGAKGNVLENAARFWKLSIPAVSILGRRQFGNALELAGEVKCCRIELHRPRPIEEAISSAGGVCWSELDGNLMVSRLPGVYLCGEMIDWEAPTGGYLLQAAFATGSRAGSAAARFNY